MFIALYKINEVKRVESNLLNQKFDYCSPKITTKKTNSTQKIKYAYVLTPKGMQEKTDITKQFIVKKKQEYDKLT